MTVDKLNREFVKEKAEKLFGADALFIIELLNSALSPLGFGRVQKQII